MARYLSDEWFALVRNALDDVVSMNSRVTIAQTVTGGPDGEVSWSVTVNGDGIHLARGLASDADVAFTQGYATAVAVARGERSAQTAFMAGDITLSGDAGALLAAAPAMAKIGDALLAVRATTTY